MICNINTDVLKELHALMNNLSSQIQSSYLIQAQEKPTVSCRLLYCLNFWLHAFDSKDSHFSLVTPPKQEHKKRKELYE